MTLTQFDGRVTMYPSKTPTHQRNTNKKDTTMRYFKINDALQVNIEKVTMIRKIDNNVDNKYLLVISYVNGMNAVEIAHSSSEERNSAFDTIESVINEFQLRFIKIRDMFINLENITMINKQGDEDLFIYVLGMDIIKLWYDSTEERNNEFERIENRINYFQ